MPRITCVEPKTATGKAKQLLDAVQSKLGMTPNLMKTLAAAPAALDAYLGFVDALATGVLDPQFREQIALATAEANSCEYCLSAHSALASMTGLDTSEISASRAGTSLDAKRAAGLRFVQAILTHRGDVPDDVFRAVRGAGYTDAEITEMVAHVAINVFTNYFNHVAQTAVDFPRVAVAAVAR